MIFVNLPTELFAVCFTQPAKQFVIDTSSPSFHLDRVDSCRQSFEQHNPSYLTFRDWVELDGALTNRKLRRLYLGMIRGMVIPAPRSSEVRDYVKFLRWLQVRGILLSGIVVNTVALDASREIGISSAAVEEILFSSPAKEEFLQAVAMVCRFSAHNHVLNCDGNDRVTCPALKRILRATSRLETLSVRGCKFINNQILNKLPTLAPYLTALYMSKCRLLAEDLVTTISQLPLLRKLDLSSCISYQTASTILQVRPQLEELSINNLVGSLQHTRPDIVRNQIDNLACSLRSNGRSLKLLAIKECSLLIDNDLIPWLAESPPLRQLSVATCRGLTNRLLFALAEHCPMLEALDLRDGTRYTDQGLVELAGRCHRLCDVAIDGCSRITTAGVESFYRPASARKVKVTFTQCYNVQGCKEEGGY